MSFHRPALLAASVAAALSLAGEAQASWHLDRTFGTGGRFERITPRWSAPVTALPGGAGTTLVRTDSELLRVTAGGRADATFGSGGAVGRPLDYGARLTAVRWGARTLLYQRWQSSGFSSETTRAILALDGQGRELPVGPLVSTATTVGETAASPSHWLIPTSDRQLLDLTALGGRWSAMTVGADGSAGTRVPLSWPAGLPRDPLLPVEPVRSGARVLVAIQDGYSGPPRAIVGLGLGGALDPTWGTKGAVRLRFDPITVLPWRGGAVVVGRRQTLWLDRRGALVGRRALNAGVATLDRHGRLLVARQGDGYRAVSVLRLRTNRRVDRSFGTVTLRAAALADPVAILEQPDGRVTVVGSRVRFETIEDLREDFTDLVSRGTVVWRLRAR
jgi:hypothetical protein